MQLEINVETLLPTAEGSSGIVLEVGGLEIATPLPSFRSRRRGTLEEDACEPWPEMRAVCQGHPTLWALTAQDKETTMRPPRAR